MQNGKVPMSEELGTQKEQLDLKMRTEDFALRIIKLYCALPRSTVAQVLGKQVLRSGTSVGANYREAKRARSKAEFISKMGDCLKELDETEYWFGLLVKAGQVDAQRMDGLLDETAQLLAIFASSIKTAKERD